MTPTREGVVLELDEPTPEELDALDEILAQFLPDEEAEDAATG